MTKEQLEIIKEFVNSHILNLKEYVEKIDEFLALQINDLDKRIKTL